MSWTAFHSRGETLRAVVDTANAHQDGILPMQVPGVDQNFTDELDLVGALLLKWHARLSGNLERALMREPMDLQSAVAAAWRTTAEQLPGVRLVVDRCTHFPETAAMAAAMDRAREHEWIWLAVAAGLANDQGPRAVAAGRRIEEQAREGLDPELTATLAVERTAPADTAMATPAGQVEERATEDSPSGEAADARTSTASFVQRIRAVLAA